MRNPTAILAIVMAFPFATAANAALPSPSDSLNKTYDNSKAAIETVVDQGDAQDIAPIAPKFPKVPLATSTPSDPGAFKPLPFNPPAISPDLIKGPNITDIRLAINDGRLKINWKTDRPATAKVAYGPTDQYGTTLENATASTTHELTLPVNPGRLHFKLSSTDAKKTESTTPDMTVQIPDYANDDVTVAATSTPPQPATDGQRQALTDDDKTNLTAEAQKEEKAPTKPETSDNAGITAMDAALGGAAVLLLGVLVGIFLPKRPKAE